MTPSRLFLLFLILLQLGLVAGRAHAHTCATNLQSHHSDPAHVHAHQLLDRLLPESGDQNKEDSDDHDADAFDVSGLATVHTPSHSEVLAVELPPAFAASSSLEFAGSSPFLIGLPPSIAGPPRPLYLTFCSFRN